MSQFGKFVPIAIGFGTVGISTMVDHQIADLVVLVIGVTVALGLFYWLRSLALKSQNNSRSDRPRLDS